MLNFFVIFNVLLSLTIAEPLLEKFFISESSFIVNVPLLVTVPTLRFEFTDVVPLFVNVFAFIVPKETVLLFSRVTFLVQSKLIGPSKSVSTIRLKESVQEIEPLDSLAKLLPTVKSAVYFKFKVPFTTTEESVPKVMLFASIDKLPPSAIVNFASS